MVVVVLPTPPFWFAIAMILAGPWMSSGAGFGMGPRVVNTVGSPGPRSAPRSRADCSARVSLAQAAPRSSLLVISGFALPPPRRLYDTHGAQGRLPLGVSRRTQHDAGRDLPPTLLP